MNQIVISKTQPQHGKVIETSVIVVDSELSVLDFDDLFRSKLDMFLTCWQDINNEVKTNRFAYQQFEEGSDDYAIGLQVFSKSFDEQLHFEQTYNTFVHGDFKISLKSFIQHDTVCEFSILDLHDWISIKKAESSVGFSNE